MQREGASGQAPCGWRGSRKRHPHLETPHQDADVAAVGQTAGLGSCSGLDPKFQFPPALLLPFHSTLLPPFNACCLLFLPPEPCFLSLMRFPTLYHQTLGFCSSWSPTCPPFSSLLLVLVFLPPPLLSSLDLFPL